MSIDSNEYRLLSDNIFSITSQALNHYQQLSDTLRMQMLNKVQDITERQLKQKRLDIESQIRMGRLNESYMPTKNDKRLALFLNALGAGVSGYASAKGEQIQKNYLEWLNTLSGGTNAGTPAFGVDAPINYDYIVNDNT